METKNKKGQVMILIVISLGGMLLSASVIAGVLLMYQVRNANDSVNSAKAIFAADAGIEAASFCLFSSRGGGCDPISTAESISFDDGAVGVDVEVVSDSPDLIKVVSRGSALGGKIVRSFEAFFAP